MSSTNPRPKRHRRKPWSDALLGRALYWKSRLPKSPREDLLDIVQDEFLQATARVMVRTEPIRQAERLRPEELVAAVVASMEESARIALLSLDHVPMSWDAQREGRRLLTHAAQMLEMPVPGRATP